MNYTLHNGNSAEILKQYPDNHFDSIVTDPPYGIGFLGKDWDSNTGDKEVYEQCFRVLKPGGYILAFSAARTYHHLAMTIERVGFEIRDQIMWIYGSGFPKSQDVGRNIQKQLGVKETKTIIQHNIKGKNGLKESAKQIEKIEQVVPTDPLAKQWEGWGTALKPAHEPIVMARKPMKHSVVENVKVWGTGALNIDACRVPYESEEDLQTVKGWSNKAKGKGRYKYFDNKTDNTKTTYDDVDTFTEIGRFPANVIGEIPDYQKYFYCPKVSRSERHIGLDNPGPQTKRARDENGKVLGYAEKIKGVSPTMIAERLKDSLGNNHPTVKPVELMKYLIKLVTPPNSKVLDPFNGSGSTGMAAVSLAHHYTGIDLDEKYIEISKKRIEAYNSGKTTFTDLFEEE